MVFACCSYQSQAEDLNALKVKEYRLENGLTVWLNEDHSQPKVFGAVVVKAGAKDCPDTGIAHYFEHMMFKGTDRIGALMSIPGVSGSVTLMVLGQYNKVYGAVSECTDMLKYLISGEFDRAWESSRSIWLVLAFAIGGIAGFILISKLIAKLLAKFEA